jgi:tetratricopeptide (TPR) repeat protein
MDLSKLKWVVIFGVLGLIVFLGTGKGMDYVYDKATDSLPGNDLEEDVVDEAALSKYAGFLMSTLQYKKAKQFYIAAIERYNGQGEAPQGNNYWYNVYQLARCHEKLEEYEDACTLLYECWKVDADKLDERVKDNDTLRLRMEKLIELHELHNMGFDFP